MSATRDLTGLVFGELTVLKRDKNIGMHSGWLCQCSCGNKTVAASSKLTGGHIKSCGHLKRDVNHTGLRTGYQDKKQGGIAVFLLDENRKVRTDNTTGVTGVKIKKLKNGTIRYGASITIKGKRTWLGTYSTIEQAAAAREKAQRDLLPKK